MAVSSASIKTGQPYRKQTPPPLDFTVVICTYNGEHRLPDVLDRLRNQTGVEGLCWEILIVDNNSHDQTAAVIQRYQQNWPAAYPIQYLFEAQQGASYARKRGVREARSELIGFLDDDNLPEEGWVMAAYQFGYQHPLAGAYGSYIQGEFEGSVPKDFDRISAYFALTQRGSEPRLYDPRRKILPPGAGLVVRRQAWLEAVPKMLHLTGPKGSLRLSGEDIEAVARIQVAKWQLWYVPSMRVQHKIPARRLTRAYLIPFFRAIGLSRYTTRMISFPRWQQPLVLPLYMLNDCRKLALHVLKHRRQAWLDVTAACELQLYWSSLCSPFYTWRQLFPKKERSAEKHSSVYPT